MNREPGTRPRRLDIPGIVYGVLFLLALFGSLIPSKFLSFVNFELVARHSSILVIAAIGMTMTILVSQIDLSVGSVLSLSAVILGVSLRSGLSLPISVFLGILAGVVMGGVNGLMVAVLRFDFWISTFATMGIGAGLALVVSSGRTIPVFNDTLDWIGNGKIFGMYVMIWITLLLVLFMWFVLRYTVFGYNIYSIGGSEQAARLSGIGVVKNRILVYAASGLFASIAGVILAGMGNAASPNAGSDYSFDAIAAVIIGGTPFEGGKGGLAGTVFGALMLRVLSNGLNCLGIASTWQKAIIGFLIVVILVANVLNEKRKKKNDTRRVYAE
jgi:ribose/xylose/arabinose/galactoside ABC-type transport system permease subunit